MRKLRSFFPWLNKSVLITLGISLLVMLFACSFRWGGLNASSSILISNTSAWAYQHTATLLVWHAFIIGAIYIGWGKGIERIGQERSASSLRIVAVKRYRWILIGGILLMDVLSRL